MIQNLQIVQAVEFFSKLAEHPSAPAEMVQHAKAIRALHAEHGTLHDLMRDIYRLADEAKPLIEDAAGQV